MNRKICYYLDEVDKILNGKVQFPVSCEIDPSNRCQNNCTFCLFHKHRTKAPVDMDYKTYKNLVIELMSLGVKSITVTGGGEPLMNPHFVEMVKFAVGNFELGLVTNGIGLAKVDHLLSSFKFVRVSLNAGTRETYNKVHGCDHFDTVIENVRRAVKMRSEATTIGLSYVVCDLNRDETTEAGRLADELNVDYVQFKPDLNCEIKPFSISEHSKSIVTPRFKAEYHLPCAIAGLVGIIGADHNVYYCCQHRGSAKYSLGSLHDEPFGLLWMKRKELKPDLDSCPPCRYMNYARGYEEFGQSKYSFLRHKNFL